MAAVPERSKFTVRSLAAALLMEKVSRAGVALPMDVDGVVAVTAIVGVAGAAGRIVRVALLSVPIV